MKFQFLPENFSRSENAPPFETRKIRHFEVERIFLENKKMVDHFQNSPPTGLLVGFFVSGVYWTVLLRQVNIPFFFSFCFRSIQPAKVNPRYWDRSSFHFEAKNLLLPQWESAGRASDVFGANCSNQYILRHRRFPLRRAPFSDS